MTALIKNRWDKVGTTDTSSGKSSQNNYDMRSVLPTVTELLSRQEDISTTKAAQECASLPGFCELQVLIINLSSLQSLPQHLDAGQELCRTVRKPRDSPASGLVAVSSLSYSFFFKNDSSCAPSIPHTFNLMPVASFPWKERHQKEAGRHI